VTPRGELVGGPTSEAAAPSTSATTAGRVAPLAAVDPSEKHVEYSSEAVKIVTPEASDVEFERAVAVLEKATAGVHACVARTEAKHRRLKRMGPIDPLLCVYANTAMDDQPGPVRFDIATTNGYSYYTDANGLRLRYSEYDGMGCRSTDALAGCSSW
ncbi:MAG: hypothetical protein ABI200_06280, partial [Gaiellales bacterium]